MESPFFDAYRAAAQGKITGQDLWLEGVAHDSETRGVDALLFGKRPLRRGWEIRMRPLPALGQTRPHREAKGHV